MRGVAIGGERTTGPAGLGRRRPRLTDAQTERAVLDAALRQLDGGLTVSLEHVSFERVVTAAGVSRASAYRRWPQKDLFLADLLLEVARATNLGEDERGVYVAALHELACRADELLEPAARRDLLVDLLRRALDADLRTLAGAPRWRTYVAVRATVAGLPEGHLRSAVSAELQATEGDFTRRRAELFALLADLVGYRPAGGLSREDGFRVLAEALGVMSTGLLVRALAARSSAVEVVEAAPLGTTTTRPWTLPALVVTTVTFAFLEPDPAVIWDRGRVELVRAGVAAALEAPAWRCAARVASDGGSDVEGEPC